MEKLYLGKQLFISDYFTDNWSCPLPGFLFASFSAANVIVSIEVAPLLPSHLLQPRPPTVQKGVLFLFPD